MGWVMGITPVDSPSKRGDFYSKQKTGVINLRELGHIKQAKQVTFS